MGKDPEQKQLRRNKLETVHSAYCRKDTVVMEVALEEYYRLLTENVKKVKQMQNAKARYSDNMKDKAK